ncbi:MAG: hypothetical protein BWY83_02936 [bacterium ADurb.Bin478]|nr:MAG: hypothetical protein BWY83_02936 [bacterium ADurb.Bin478]
MVLRAVAFQAFLQSLLVFCHQAFDQRFGGIQTGFLHAQRRETGFGHQPVAGRQHVYAVAGQDAAIRHVRLLQRQQHATAGGILIHQQAFVFFRNIADRLIVENQLFVFRAAEVFFNDRCREQGDAGVLTLSPLYHGDHLFPVDRQRNTARPIPLGVVVIKTMPDVVDPHTDGHPVRLPAQHVRVKAIVHIRRLVAADPGVDDVNGHLRIEHLQGFSHQRDIPLGRLAALGNAVAQGNHHLLVTEQQWLRSRCSQEQKTKHNSGQADNISFLHALLPFYCLSIGLPASSNRRTKRQR